MCAHIHLHQMANYMSDEQKMALQQQQLGKLQSSSTYQNNDGPQITLAIPIERLSVLS